jgi:hypothetical protein
MELKISREMLDLAVRLTRGHRCLDGVLSGSAPQMVDSQRLSVSKMSLAPGNSLLETIFSAPAPLDRLFATRMVNKGGRS